jgi:hypothetical protein
MSADSILASLVSILVRDTDTHVAFSEIFTDSWKIIKEPIQSINRLLIDAFTNYCKLVEKKNTPLPTTAEEVESYIANSEDKILLKTVREKIQSRPDIHK